MVITSKNNPLIKETVSLKEKKGRKEHRSFLVEGHKMAMESLNSPLQTARIFMTPAYADEYGALFPVELCVTVSEDVMRHLCDEKTPQGVVCRVAIPQTEKVRPTDNCLILDGVADPGNMGAIIRTANAAGYDALYLTKDCTDPFSPKSVRASMSGIFATKIIEVEREELPILFSGFDVFVADMVGENAFSVLPNGPFALAIGNEGRGLSTQVRDMATKVVSIPMKGGQESLNASVAAGVLMYLLSKEKFITK